MLVLAAMPAMAQNTAKPAAENAVPAAQAAQAAQAAPAAPEQSPEQAVQESEAAFDEAARAGEAPEAETLAEEQTKAPQNASYGSFLDHPEKPQSTDIMATGNSLVSTAFSTAAYLCLILGGIFFAYWLLRRFGPHGIARSRDMVSPQLAGRLMLGPKRHVDIIRVQGKTYLLGVTDHSINLLTEIDAQPGQCFDDEDEDEFTDFTEMLGKQADSGGNTGDA